MRSLVAFVACATLACGIAGCAALKEGPDRPISLADDVAWARDLVTDDLAKFGVSDLLTQAYLRNEIVTTRMYIADAEYHFYEARLTKDMQEEGFAATVANLGLTASATLIPVVQTKTLLSGIATGLTGVDKAVGEKILLNNAIQALQTQMRADRKTQAAIIYTRMLKEIGNTKVVTSIGEYTLPMAMSDADTYYQMGTMSSALIGLSKTVANADQSADQEKLKNGPNGEAAANVKAASLPQNIALAPTVRPSVRSNPRGGVVTRGDIGIDDARKILTQFVYPNGVLNARDKAHEQDVKDFMREQNINGPVSFFLDSGSFANQRAVLVSRLRGRRVIP